jgi:predicted nuclease of predicted toxin-antitoxin system
MILLIDMNLSPRWAEFLTEAGHTAHHWISIGAGNAPDIEILEYASHIGAVILTQDLDFGTILALSGSRSPSVIQVRAQATLPTDIGPQVLNTLQVAEQHLQSGALVTLTPAAYRISVLPLRPTDSA